MFKNTHTHKDLLQAPYGINSLGDLNSCRNPIKSNLGIQVKFPDLTHTLYFIQTTVRLGRWGENEYQQKTSACFFTVRLYSNGEAGDYLNASVKSKQNIILL